MYAFTHTDFFSWQIFDKVWTFQTVIELYLSCINLEKFIQKMYAFTHTDFFSWQIFDKVWTFQTVIELYLSCINLEKFNFKSIPLYRVVT